jgi:hypothetical protein
MSNNLVSWITDKPVAGLLMIVTAVVLFGSALKKSRATTVTTFWPWLRRIIEASTRGFLFLGLLGALYVILDTNNKTFDSTHREWVGTKQRSAEAIWGKPILQRELTVNHFVDIEKQEEIPREDPTEPPRYRTVRERQPIPQNSIVGFRGKVDMRLSEPEKRAKGQLIFNGYTLEARYEYNVVNESDLETEAEFNFPLAPEQILYDNFSITADGQNINSQLQFAPDVVSWKSVMKPQQQSEIMVTYTARGMEDYFYQVPVQREIKNFALTLTVNSQAIHIITEPGSELTRPEYETTNNGAILSWQLDRTIMAPKLGLVLDRPERLYAPHVKVFQVLRNGPHALILMATTLALTLLIRGKPIRFLDLALISGACCGHFFIIAGVSDCLGLWGSLALGASLVGLLTFLLFHKLPSILSRVLIYILVGFFTVAYPLSGLFNETAQRNSFDAIVQVGLIVYLFGLSLYTRIERAG